MSEFTAALEASLLRELRITYDWENRVRFRNALTPAVLVLTDATTRLGQWLPRSRHLELSRPLLLDRPWPEAVSVLGHEMAHQFVDEVLKVIGEPAHGPTFQRVCAERGLDAAAAGIPTVHADASTPTDRTLERIRKLLALAGSSSQAEAELAMRRAHELMLRHNLDLQADAAVAATYTVRHLGDPATRISRVERDVMGVLAEFFFVRVIQIPVYQPLLGKNGAVFEIAGTRANVELASHVYAFLLATAARLWRDNRGDARVRSGRDWLSYQAGVIRGFRDKLLAERAELRSVGLIWRGDRALDRYYHQRHPRIASVQRQVRVDGAHAAGREAGRQIVLHQPVGGSSSSGPRRRLGPGVA